MTPEMHRMTIETQYKMRGVLVCVVCGEKWLVEHKQSTSDFAQGYGGRLVKCACANYLWVNNSIEIVACAEHIL